MADRSKRGRGRGGERPVEQRHGKHHAPDDKLTILVTGAAGFIGSNIAKELERLGHFVVALDNFTSGDFRNLKGFRGDIIPESIYSGPWNELLPNFDVVFHQAAVTDTRIGDQKLVLDMNYQGSISIIEAAVRHDVKVIYASSAAVYGNLPAPLKEDGPTDPLNIYAFSKLKLDEYVLDFREREGADIPIVGLRYFNVHGPGERYKGDFASMVFQLAKQAMETGRVKLFKHGEQYRDHLHVRNVVAANLLALDFDGCDIFNIGLGVTTSFNQILKAVEDGLRSEGAIGKSAGHPGGKDKIEVEWIDNPYPFYQDHTLADIGKARKLLGYAPDADAMPGMIEYVRQIARGEC